MWIDKPDQGGLWWAKQRGKQSRLVNVCPANGYLWLHFSGKMRGQTYNNRYFRNWKWWGPIPEHVRPPDPDESLSKLYIQGLGGLVKTEGRAG